MRAEWFLLASVVVYGCVSDQRSLASSPTSQPAASPSFRQLAVSNDHVGFTRLAATRLAAILTDVSVQVLDSAPRTVRVGQGAEEAHVSLDRPFAGCRVEPASCDDETAAFLERTAQILRRESQDTGPTLERLRLAVRTVETVAMYRARVPDLITRPLFGDLEAIVMVDLPEAARPLFASDLPALAMSEEDVVRRARSNVLEELGPLVPPYIPGPNDEAMMSLSAERYYESSSLLEPTRFAALAMRFGGRLYVSVPSVDHVLIVGGSAPNADPAIRTVTADLHRRSQRPLSSNIFLWENGEFSSLPVPNVASH